LSVLAEVALLKHKVEYSFHKNLSLIPILNHKKPVHINCLPILNYIFQILACIQVSIPKCRMYVCSLQCILHALSLIQLHVIILILSYIARNRPHISLYALSSRLFYVQIFPQRRVLNHDKYEYAHFFFAFTSRPTSLLASNRASVFLFMLTPGSREQQLRCASLIQSFAVFWTLLIMYYKYKFKSSGDKASPCFRPFTT
jgi:hypothetical protein